MQYYIVVASRLAAANKSWTSSARRTTQASIEQLSEPVAREKKRSLRSSYILLLYRQQCSPPLALQGEVLTLFGLHEKRSCGSTRQGGLFVCHGPSSYCRLVLSCGWLLLDDAIVTSALHPKTETGAFHVMAQRPVGLRPSVHSPAADQPPPAGLFTQPLPCVI